MHAERHGLILTKIASSDSQNFERIGIFKMVLTDWDELWPVLGHIEAGEFIPFIPEGNNSILYPFTMSKEFYVQ
jgi:hypothetical protein